MPHESANFLRDHVRHELELLAELQTAGERFLDQLALTPLLTPLLTGDLHVEVVQVKRFDKGHYVQEYGLRVSIVDDLLLGHQELRVYEVLVRRQLEVLLCEGSDCTILNPTKEWQEVFADNFLKGGLGTCMEEAGLLELGNGENAVKELLEVD